MVKYLIFWGIIFILAAIAECTTMQLITIWFAVGALAAVIAALCGLGFTAQFAIFVLASFLLLLLTGNTNTAAAQHFLIPVQGGKQNTDVTECGTAKGTFPLHQCIYIRLRCGYTHLFPAESVQGLLLKLGILFAEGFGGSFPFLSAGTFSIAFILFETAF